MLSRALALGQTNLTDVVIWHTLGTPKAVIEDAAHVRMPERDSPRVLAARTENRCGYGN